MQLESFIKAVLVERGMCVVPNENRKSTTHPLPPDRIQLGTSDAGTRSLDVDDEPVLERQAVPNLVLAHVEGEEVFVSAFAVNDAKSTNSRALEREAGEDRLDLFSGRRHRSTRQVG